VVPLSLQKTCSDLDGCWRDLLLTKQISLLAIVVVVVLPPVGVDLEVWVQQDDIVADAQKKN